ncbi:methanesulfonate monooxygenase [Stachybotrys elegans]|uniref:Methanesulfonate monooxygenase n=1 Tax=Stachybotrys elegans TaxID=80388 RepID=A0A8K0SJW9_9HYPO|nr:methanesulfonate monooxygenase [Stachybotrys elegans]
MAAQSHPLNHADDRLLFAYWVPNVSGGLVISKIPQKTSWDLESNIRYAKAAEAAGIEYGLTQIRFLASYGAAQQHESVSFSQAILSATTSIKIIAALLPGIWSPTVAAKQIASIDHYSRGRIAVNVVSGWFKGEFTSVGEWWLDHSERYRRSNEFIRVLKGIWTTSDEKGFSFSGDFYRFNNYNLSPKPVQQPHPEIFQGGNSDDAKNNAAEVSDWYFMNGNDLDGFRAQIEDVKARAARNNHSVRFAVNGFVIVRETEEEAIRVLQEIQGKADKEAVEAFRDAVKEAGASTSNKVGMWANSKFDDLVQYNDGFKTKLIGTKEQVAERLVLLKSLGINLVLTAFLHYEDEIEQFGQEVLPLVRQYEKEGRGKDADFEIARTGDVYRKK